MPHSVENDSIRSIHEKYRFKKKLGKGGFCDVFKAVEKANGRPVAVKMLRKANLHESDGLRHMARFQQEIRFHSELRHPNIAGVLESGQTDDVLYIVFEFVDGITLGALLKKEGALTVKNAITVARQVLDGLTAAHDHGSIHCDLKPDNIMLSQTEYQEKATILDFGICSLLSGTWNHYPRLMIPREFPGTSAYAAPEQLRGEPATAKSDLYSLGVILLECLTGKSPFAEAGIAGVTHQKLSEKTPLQLPPLLMNHPFGGLLSWLTEKDIDRRAGNSREVLDRLKNIPLDSIPRHNGFLSTSNFPSRRERLEPPAGVRIASLFL